MTTCESVHVALGRVASRARRQQVVCLGGDAAGTWQWDVSQDQAGASGQGPCSKARARYERQGRWRRTERMAGGWGPTSYMCANVRIGLGPPTQATYSYLPAGQPPFITMSVYHSYMETNQVCAGPQDGAPITLRSRYTCTTRQRMSYIGWKWMTDGAPFRARVYVRALSGETRSLCCAYRMLLIRCLPP